MEKEKICKRCRWIASQEYELEYSKAKYPLFYCRYLPPVAGHGHPATSPNSYCSKWEIPEIEQKVKELLKQNIDTLEVSVRAENVFRAAGFSTIGDLVRKTAYGENGLTRYRGVGGHTLNDINCALRRLGLSLGMEVPDDED